MGRAICGVYPELTGVVRIEKDRACGPICACSIVNRDCVIQRTLHTLERRIDSIVIGVQQMSS